VNVLAVLQGELALELTLGMEGGLSTKKDGKQTSIRPKHALDARSQRARDRALRRHDQNNSRSILVAHPGGSEAENRGSFHEGLLGRIVYD
jgi:hypothetical protein